MDLRNHIGGTTLLGEDAPDAAFQKGRLRRTGKMWGNGNLMAEDFETAIGQLTPGQIECLLLVHQNLTSKEIAPRLGISPHTVDQRVRIALRTLGCKRRAHAAQLVSSRTNPNRMFKWRSPGNEPFAEYQARPLVRYSRQPFPLPFATSQYPRNEMSIPLRLLWIVGIACGAAFSMGVYLAGLGSLARLIQGT